MARRSIAFCVLALSAAALGAAGCAGSHVAPMPLVAMGDTQDKVERSLGAPNTKLERKVLEQDVEIWSYDRPNRLFVLDDCWGFVQQPFRVNGQQIDGRQCRERARVVFSGGKVVAFEQKD
jgi:hypothetical protein